MEEKLEIYVFKSCDIFKHKKFISFIGEFSLPRYSRGIQYSNKIWVNNNIARLDVFGDYILIPKSKMIKFPLSYCTKWPELVEIKYMTKLDWKNFKNIFKYYI